MSRRSTRQRMVICALAALVAVLHAPTFVRAPLGLASLCIVAESLWRSTSGADLRKAAMAFGGTIVAVLAVGFALDATHIGIYTSTWALSWGVVAIALLWWNRSRRCAPGHVKWSTFTRLPVVAAGALVTLVVVVSFVVASRSSSQALAPPMEFYLARVEPSSVTVAVRAPDGGRFDVELTSAGQVPVVRTVEVTGQRPAVVRLPVAARHARVVVVLRSGGKEVRHLVAATP